MSVSFFRGYVLYVKNKIYKCIMFTFVRAFLSLSNSFY